MIRIINFVSSSESPCVWRAFSFLLKSSFLLQIRPAEMDWASLNRFFLSLIHLFSVNVYFYFLSKGLNETLFWQQKPKMNTGLCLLFLVLSDNNILTSVSLRLTSSLFFIWHRGTGAMRMWVHVTISWTQKSGGKGKRATVTGVQTFIDFQHEVLRAAAQKRQSGKKGPNTDKV